MKVKDYLLPTLTYVLPAQASRDDLLREMTRRIAETLPVVKQDELYTALLARESQAATSTPEKVAFPHAMVEGLDKTYVAAARVEKGCKFGNAQHGACDLVFLLIGPPDAAWEHLRLLARLARICHATGAMASLRGARTAEELYDRLLSEDAKHG